MNRFITTCLVILITAFGVGCSNDIDTNADSKEIMIVYGLLNVNDTTHYLRISRAFLTQGQSALEVAKTNDTAYLNGLEVKIDEFDISSGSAVYKTTYTLTQDFSVAKDTGIFASYPNILFSFNQQLTQGYEYRLTVTNTKTGNIATATTELVHDPNPSNPSDFTSLYLIDPGKILPVNFSVGKNATINDLIMRFYWDEYDSATNQVVDSNVFIDWNMVQNAQNTISGRIQKNVSSKTFYSFLRTRLNHQIGRYRVPKKIDFIYWSADDEFVIYRQVNTPSVGIVQSRPDYTNISNGNYGLFASRNRFIISDVTISDFTTEFLRTNSETRHLKFRLP